MARPYPQELRDRVLAAYDRGLPTRQIAELFQVSPAWARRIKQRRRDRGETAPQAMGGRTVAKIDEQRLRELVEKQPDATTLELHQQLGVDCSPSAVDMAMRRLKLSFKKRRSTRRSRTGRTSPSGGPDGGPSSRSGTPGG